MKIVIGTNTFGKYHRQDVAVESWKHLSDVKLVNVQFEDEKDSFNVQYDMEHVFAPLAVVWILLISQQRNYRILTIY